jgi:ribosomal protein L37AE/L43A
MIKNMIQFQPGLSLAAFLKKYGTEKQCRDALGEWRWTKEYECPNCGHHSACKLEHRGLYQCNRCHHQGLVMGGDDLSGHEVALKRMVSGHLLYHPE